MERKLLVEIKTMDLKECRIVPEEGTEEKDYTKEELSRFRKNYVKGLHEEIVKGIKEMLTKDEVLLDKIWDSEYSWEGGESLKDTVERATPFLKETIFPYLKKNRNVLVAAHGNILRAIVMILDKMPPEKVAHLEIPTGSALVYETRVTGQKLSWKRVQPEM